MPRLVETLRKSGIACETLFLRADSETLLKRFRETRRRHPLSRHGAGLIEALEQEERLLAPLANAADLTIDTSRLSVHELRELIRGRVDDRAKSGPSLLFQSFAYRHGVPDDADFVFDARSLPNPYWDPALRDLTGRDEPVAKFLDNEAEVNRFFENSREPRIQSILRYSHYLPRRKKTNHTGTVCLGKLRASPIEQPPDAPSLAAGTCSVCFARSGSRSAYMRES